MTAGTVDENNAELPAVKMRFWIGAALTVPVFALAMAHLLSVLGKQPWVDSHGSHWIQFVLATTVVCWAVLQTRLALLGDASFEHAYADRYRRRAAFAFSAVAILVFVTTDRFCLAAFAADTLRTHSGGMGVNRGSHWGKSV